MIEFLLYKYLRNISNLVELFKIYYIKKCLSNKIVLKYEIFNLLLKSLILNIYKSLSFSSMDYSIY